MTIEDLQRLLRETEEWFVAQGQNYAAQDSLLKLEAVERAVRALACELATHGQITSAELERLLHAALSGGIPDEAWGRLSRLASLAAEKREESASRLRVPTSLPDNIERRAGLLFQGKVKEIEHRIGQERQEKRRRRSIERPTLIVNSAYEVAEDGEAKAMALPGAYLDAMVEAFDFFKTPIRPYLEAISGRLGAMATSGAHRDSLSGGGYAVPSAFASRAVLRIAGAYTEVARRLKLLEDEEPVAPATRSWRDIDPTELTEFPELSTKRAFDANVTAAMSESSEAQPLSMVFVDVDDLKALNSKFTNPRVNKGLVALARVLADVARGKGKAYRYSGGNEFAFLLPNATIGESASVAERICRAVRTLSIPDEPEMTLTVSCGVACLEDVSPRSPEALETAAAVAGRNAKEKGKDRVEVWRQV